MTIREVGSYRVGQHGWIVVLGSEGKRRLVRGEILRLIPTPHDDVHALIRTPTGTGLYRVW